MLFKNFKQSLKNKKMSIAQIVMTFVLFVIINDKGVFNGIINNINSIGNGVTTITTCPFENMITGMINLSRIIMLDYSITMGIGYMFLNIALIIAVSVAVFYLVNTSQNEKALVVSEPNYHRPESKAISSNDIYLKTNKFIC